MIGCGKILQKGLAEFASQGAIGRHPIRAISRNPRGGRISLSERR
jgi:hypothetical protein